MKRFLQISDIHFHACNEDEERFADIRERLFDDLEYVHDKFSPIDAILICGDIAFSGKRNEYEKAKKFIDKMISILSKDGGNLQVFMVPGNHDINRTSYQATRGYINSELIKDCTKANRYINKIRSSEPDALKLLYTPFEEYNKFATSYSSQDKISNAIMEGESTFSGLAMRSELSLGVLSGYSISLIGMNSALCSDENDSDEEGGDRHKLFLPNITYNLARKKSQVLISMLHHPLDQYVINGKQIQENFDNLYRIQLYGHIHKQYFKNDDVIRIYSGALEPDDGDSQNYFPIYNIIELNIIESCLNLKVTSRKWDGRRFVNHSDGSCIHTVNLEPTNTWSEEEKQNAKVEIKENLAMVDIYKVKYDFLRSLKKRNVIQKFDYKWDNSKTDMANYLLFLKFIEKEDKWDELRLQIK